jgi:YhcH/YjgK/YiaL family protein
MIKDKIENKNIYIGINKKFIDAFKYLEEKNLETLSNGVHKIIEEDIFAIVSEYKTKELDFGLWEGHKKYIDIQYIVRGNEKIGYCNLEKVLIEKQYNVDEDVLLGHANGDFITMNEGDFMILFPQDIHKPGVIDNKSATVKKIVLKVKI